MKEYWKSVNGYENEYEVSKLFRNLVVAYNKKRNYILSRLIFTTFKDITIV